MRLFRARPPHPSGRRAALEAKIARARGLLDDFCLTSLRPSPCRPWLLFRTVQSGPPSVGLAAHRERRMRSLPETPDNSLFGASEPLCVQRNRGCPRFSLSRRGSSSEKCLIAAPGPIGFPPETPDNPQFDASERAKMRRNAGCPWFFAKAAADGGATSVGLRGPCFLGAASMLSYSKTVMQMAPAKRAIATSKATMSAGANGYSL